MKLTTIETMTLNGAWWQLLRACLTDGYEYTITRGSHNEGKKRIELDCASIHITHPGLRPLAPTVPEGVPPPTSELCYTVYSTLGKLREDNISDHKTNS